MIRNFLGSITRNGISLLGTALALAGLVLIVCLVLIAMLGYEGGPYLGILTYVILPMIFIIGLVLIPIGSLLHRRKLRRMEGGEDVPALPVFDLNDEKTRRWMLVLFGATIVNVVVIAGATYKGVHYMETTEFCGLSCHSVMQPEYTAHARSPHSRVSCADCHIGTGADWFVKSKLDGSWQLIAVALDLYPRPIPTPLHDLRPAPETCEQCHWPTKHVGDKLRIFRHYEEDEQNTELTTAMLLRVGGPGTGIGDGSGIHWHVSPDVDIRYRSDETREEVWEIEYANADGTEKHYSVRRAPEEGGTWRSMDCVDCHNRPTHIYESPGPAIDTAIANGRIDRGLPFVKRESLRIIQAKYDSHEAARGGIAGELAAFYAESYPDLATARADDIAAAADALGDIYSVNVFPQMEVWWDTYPDHIGHEQSDGCFRCHKRSMRTAEREQVSDDCENCHILLAEEEENPDIVSVLNPE
ncbi:MAG: NapC/NirT family cytochrome c [Gammaproteobacteria bacterium]|nr:NapC/NirT family cytochrome c [Gammaproteobacteria bacterium]NNF49892.1 cytochrome C [Woeseiaceae bacterium]MBT8093647.1 NapC/NirT family cytochrome c [Gammaproteobacteria bacterium]MBT8104508.1 NapC/NirT family cytochrome c [Gammaproteobacteria bacterium]NNK24522.1 cytochrome C [Woeseiaceae bacterium]